ncbi:MAG: RhuM family protein [Bacteroidales bacterium]
MTKESEITFYQGVDGNVKIEVFYHAETFWMTQKKISELFGVQRPAITKHLNNIFESGELQEDSASSILEHTAEDGKNYKTTFYNLDAIIAVGYRVNSNKATKFMINSNRSACIAKIREIG